MTKLIAKYLARPTLANAQRLVAYAHKHPFAGMTLSPLERGLLADAAARAA